MDTRYLESLSLSPATIADVESEIQHIRANHKKSIRIKIENGHHCQRVKDLIGHGGWMAWMLAETAYASARTIEREMALSDALYDRLDDLETLLSEATSATALYALCRDDDSALSAALSLMKAGTRVTESVARKLTAIAGVSPALAENVSDGKLTVDDAFAVAEAITEVEAPGIVVDLVVRSGVRSAGVVEALTVMHADEPQRFKEVAASGTIWNSVADVDVPLREASSADGFAATYTHEVERIARQQAYIRSWRDQQPPRLAALEGNRETILAQLASVLGDGAFKVYVYPCEMREMEVLDALT